MALIEPLLRYPLAQAIGWALLHFVWQGALVALLTAIALAALRRSAADVRYVVASIGLALMLTLPVVTAVQRWRTEPAVAAPTAVTETVAGKAQAASVIVAKTTSGAIDTRTFDVAADAPASAPASALTSMFAIRADLVAAFVALWLLGVSVLSMRLLTGWLWVQRMRTHSTGPARDAWQQMAQRIARKLHLHRAVALLESGTVDVPTVVGWFRPVVLLPASALAGLAPSQVEAILAHELAHIRRHDYLVNLLQTLVETLLFYHPGVWWVSRRIRIERENCCDDLAVSLCGDPVGYARALADLESVRGSEFALAANGGSLLDRVRRLVGAPPSHAGRGPAWLAALAALVLVGGMAGAAETTRQSQPSPATALTRVTSNDISQAIPVPPQPPSPPTAPQPPEPPAPSSTESLPAPPAPPAPPAVPAPPAPPAPPAAPAGEQSISIRSNGSSGNWVWSHNGEKLAIDYNGTFELTDDDTDIQSVSSGGHLKISDAAAVGRHTVEIDERGGQLQRRYYVNGVERPYDPEGRAWLKSVLPRFVRNSGIGAEKRVARFLKAGGPPAVFAEIGRIDSGYVKGIYFKQLAQQAQLTPDQYRELMTEAGRDLKSDYELATLLIALADRIPADEPSRAAYFTAAGSINSSYELRRVYSTMLKKGAVSQPVLAGILQHASGITSDYDESELLREVLATQKLDDRTRPLFFKAMDTIGGDYERHRVLSAALKTGDHAAIAPALAASTSIDSDYEAASLLLESLAVAPPEGALREPFFRSVEGLASSAYEKGRVLKAVVSRDDVSHDTLMAALQAARSLNSSYECAQVLIAAADAHALTGDLGDAYLDVAGKLGKYEQGQAMAALVKSERRRN